MSLPALVFVPLAGDAAGALSRLPAAPGVGQIVGPEGRSLLLGTASNLRRWAASHLGLGAPPAARRRPRTNLLAIATAIGYAEANGRFQQRLFYERLMAPLVPLASRRDLKPPLFLHLDPAQRFPRVSVRGAEEGLRCVFGPFRDRRAAEKARDALHRRFPLRPCDYSFDPDPSLPLGIGCLYAQVGSCAAPCLARVSEHEYRALAERAAAWLADPTAREGNPVLPPTVAAAASARALVVDAGRRRIGLFPVRAGRVLDEAGETVPPAELATALERIGWPQAEGPDDWPWLCSWLRSPKARASYLVLREGEGGPALAARARAALPARFGGTLGTTREEG